MKPKEHVFVFITVVIHQIVGALWYSNAMFADQWLLAIGKAEDQLDKANPVPFVVSIVFSFMFCYFLLSLTKKLNLTHWKEAAKFGSLLAFVCSAMSLAVHYQFLGYNSALVFIDGGKEVLLGYISGAILKANSTQARV